MPGDVITTTTVATVGDLRLAMATLPDDMPIKDGLGYTNLAVSEIAEDGERYLEVS